MGILRNIERSDQRIFGERGGPRYLHDLLLLVHGEQVGHLPRVQHAVHVLQERLLLDLSVRQQEDRLLTVHSRVFEQQLERWRGKHKRQNKPKVVFWAQFFKIDPVGFPITDWMTSWKWVFQSKQGIPN